MNFCRWQRNIAAAAPPSFGLKLDLRSDESRCYLTEKYKHGSACDECQNPDPTRWQVAVGSRGCDENHNDTGAEKTFSKRHFATDANSQEVTRISDALVNRHFPY